CSTPLQLRASALASASNNSGRIPPPALAAAPRLRALAPKAPPADRLPVASLNSLLSGRIPPKYVPASRARSPLRIPARSIPHNWSTHDAAPSHLSADQLNLRYK